MRGHDLRRGGAKFSIKRFRRDEEGSLVIFGLFCFVMMLILAGVAVDLMRFEERRTVLQNTIDRASLAAADLQQTLDPKAVVRDYFVKAGLTPPADADIDVRQGSNGEFRTVEVTTAEEMPTWFMRMVGVQELGTPAHSMAEESVGQIEISLVLDVSGSMNSNSRLTNLKPAAKSFVDQIFDSTQEGKVSISIIPYSTQVALSDDLIGYFNVTNEQTISNCIEFEDDMGDFDTPAVSFGSGSGSRVYQRNGHFDPFYSASLPRMTNCPTDSDREIMAFSGDRSALKNYIDNLSASGNTSIDIGMKWGAALLDPSMQDVVDDLIDHDKVDDDFSGRPYAWSEGDTLKIIVLMTDGANTTEYRLRDDYDHGTSRLERNAAYGSDSTSLDQYSLWDATKKQYYIFAIDQWRNEPWGNSTYTTTSCSKKWGCTTTTSNDYGYSGSPQSVPMSWQAVWEKMSIYYFSDNIIYGAYRDRGMRNQYRPASVRDPEMTTYIYSTKDTRTLDICSAAKSASSRLRIYTIAFEAPSDGQTLLEACQNAGYYEVEGLDINDAFDGIVNSINKLRLTH
ncbi:MAG: Tad domain-containing protein [Rhodobacteraceae bacterium]|nr:Tad domain-containing protein [Paracoccaceae bacterium]